MTMVQSGIVILHRVNIGKIAYGISKSVSGARNEKSAGLQAARLTLSRRHSSKE